MIENETQSVGNGRETAGEIVSGNQHGPRRRLWEQLLLQVNLGTCPQKERAELLRGIDDSEFVLILGNDLRAIPLIVDALAKRFVDHAICDLPTGGRLGVAVGEAVVNAIVHGNLEVDSEIREAPGNLYDKLIEARRLDPRFRQRRVRLICQFDEHRGQIVVRDEGPGFNSNDVPDPTQEENLSRPYGRGILLIRAFFDEVHYNPKGNAVTMLKRTPLPEGEQAGADSSHGHSP